MKENKQNANALFDFLRSNNDIRTDAALAVALNTNPPTITNMRSKRLEVGPAMIIKIMRKFGLSLARIDALLATAVKE